MIESSLIEAMQEEIHEFERLKVWELVPRPDKAMITSLKWIFKVKLDEYGELFAHVTHIEAIRIFLAYAAHKNMVVFQMDVKTACLNGILKEEYGLDQCDAVDIPMVGQSKLDEDPNGTLVAKIQGKLTDYGFNFNKIPLYSDLKIGIVLSCNTVQHSKTKHIAVCYHFIKEQVENEVVEIYFVKIDFHLKHIFTKALARERFAFLINHLGLKSITPKELKRLVESDEE
ncbi:retrovirus-related pol polyprotein from transposon TNT 1-94 [Tanacetum coccineum]